VQVLRKLVEHHDALRMIYVDQKQIIQEITEKAFAFHRFDFRQESKPDEKIQQTAQSLQRGINLQQGPLIQVGLFQAPEGDHLLIIIHHLVVDGVSWRILLEDLTIGYQQICQQQEIQWPAKTHSYQVWSQALHRMANEKKVLQELPYWRQIEEQINHPIPRKHPSIGVARFQDMEACSIEWEEKITHQLLSEAHRAYHTEINDLLLAALVLTVRECTEEKKMAVLLEGHGREEIVPGVDISRTVGWFTSMYPVLLEAQVDELSALLKEVKEQLRRVPHKGSYYGVLTYLTAPEKKQGLLGKQRPEISFNYLGNFTPVEGAFSLSPIPMGDQISPDSEVITPIEITCLVAEERFQLLWRYDRRQYDREVMQKMVNTYDRHLRRIVNHCVHQEEADFTPSDFTAQDELTTEDLDDIFEILEESASEQDKG
jgi:non-ribosomal peptide synthase protein (TIGR01720 family)